jgi:glutathione S-transferase
MQLYIGNKNYSSWSMRPWVLMTHFGLPFEEVLVRFDSFDPGSRFKAVVGALAPTGKVPLLVDGRPGRLGLAGHCRDPGRALPQHPLWPADPAARARARSLCAEMHSGFGALRNACPMNIEASLPEVGAQVLREQPAVAADLARLQTMWTEALAASGGPFLFGDFGIVDAYYAPVVARLRSYALPVSPTVQAYMDRVWASPGVAAWVAQALAERDFLDFEEPYRQAPGA